ncbi:D-alanyl-D-alanine carboxypeptidase/D-alanyl-D-alanine-endopeptidase [Streptantibioticus rubrisoli]|uniref:D-alanyl-D-alanine carboxypeptidase/D-alanyl-D-alanine-endopeptidase n=1 Tax=Streptantibioticus rubrisoli TaxID=1387313 RepID=A0ABT1PGR8_9ACTN|nr:D-alanyl-D-alanine carboxypeptidase/D-alanyl-D-alanine-endopeptidase [Streptantibioticus rubrisoli]MCQ4044554.1 D-alanyl-D-alanine carboxypeptidase/D-alanyl-D-alanine-endopeptidase [Streptantibioticus rubrisoli]
MVVGAGGVGLALALVAIAAAGPWADGQRVAERNLAAAREAAHHTGRTPATAPSAPPVLAGLGPGATPRAVPLPTGQGLDNALSPLFDDPALGAVRTGIVLDAATGQQLYGHDPDTPSAPASTTKIATAVAASQSLGGDYRIATTVVPGAAPGSIVLVGGGDPTLTIRPTPQGADPDATPASLSDLADATARTLKERGWTKVRLSYDTSLYTGPPRLAGVDDENLASVTPLMVDEGRIDPNSVEAAPRAADPANAAAQAFAGLLRERGITVDGDVRPGNAPAGEEARLAEVDSMPLSALVERMLTNSDNDIAEALARQTAISLGQPVSFAGAAQAVSEELGRLGLPLAGTRFNDGSGLDRDDRLTARLLARLLHTAADPAHPQLRPVLSGLPIAGFTGTLSDRFSGATSDAAGLVHAKTGTLTGVNTLAGTVVDADGRLLVFAFMASGTGNAGTAVAALDRLAATVSNCGCR